MNRLRAAVRMELLLQRRYKFLHAAVFSGLLWIAVLLPVPTGARGVLEPYVVFGDLGIVGYFFIAAAVFFEKDERTLDAVANSPLRFGEYLGAKLIVLTGLSVVLSALVATATRGVHYDLPLLVLGAALGALPMLLGGFCSALPFTSAGDWFLLGIVPLAVLTAPVFHYSGAFGWPVFYLLPTQGPLQLIGAAFGQVDLTGWQFAYPVGYPVLFVAVALPVARRMFARYALSGEGAAA
ncbi:fluoroquinolone transporter permease [Saccharopolyspora griseoalba]|uniref:Fluoroquinolone transporter permease n=1 Tax=Saccharopolyspora griseoalba TaxID=1431848 RepID=A0ABW2LCN1_9PSEU